MADEFVKQDRPKDQVYQRFRQVDEHIDAFQPLIIYRSSSPNYFILERDSDRTQNFTSAALEFLVEKGINGIISFNRIPYDPAAQDGLRRKNIQYKHVPVGDGTAATFDQFRECIDFVSDVKKTAEHPAVLIHCGYGAGRTGTAVTAIQLWATRGGDPSEELWAKSKESGGNEVEQLKQLERLREWRDQVRKELK